MEIENESIKALRRRLKATKDSHDTFARASRIVLAGDERAHTLAQILALGVDPNLAESLLNPQSLVYNTHSIATSERTINYIQSQLNKEIAKESERMKKKGLL